MDFSAAGLTTAGSVATGVTVAGSISQSPTTSISTSPGVARLSATFSTAGSERSSSSKSISSSGASSSACDQTEQTRATGSLMRKQVTQMFWFSGCQMQGWRGRLSRNSRMLPYRWGCVMCACCVAGQHLPAVCRQNSAWDGRRAFPETYKVAPPEQALIPGMIVYR